MTTHRPLYRFLAFGLALGLVWLAIIPAFAHPSSDSTRPLVAQNDAAGNWLHYGYDSAYTGYNPLENTIGVENIAQLEQKWGLGCGESFFGLISRSPAVFNGTLYTTGEGLVAFDAQTGDRLWQYDDGNVDWAPPPVVSEDGIVFYLEGNDPSYLYAIDAASGEQLWKSPLGFELGFNNTAVVTVDEINGLVYLLETPFGSEGKLFALEKETGEVAWFKSKATDDVGFKGDYPLLSDGKLYAATVGDFDHSDRMLRVDVSSLETEALFDQPAGIELREICSYSLCGGQLAITYCDPHLSGTGGALVVYDALSQEVQWQQEYATPLSGSVACHPTNQRFYVPTEPYLYALDATTGEEIWKYTGYSAIYNPSIANGVVYFMSDTNMYAVSETDGTPVFRHPLGFEAHDTAQVAISDGMIYFSGHFGDCNLLALGLPAASAE